jgi:hypothetical protein
VPSGSLALFSEPNNTARLAGMSRKKYRKQWGNGKLHITCTEKPYVDSYGRERTELQFGLVIELDDAAIQALVGPNWKPNRKGSDANFPKARLDGQRDCS